MLDFGIRELDSVGVIIWPPHCNICMFASSTEFRFEGGDVLVSVRNPLRRGRCGGLDYYVLMRV